MNFRVETDMMGSREVPASSYFGVHTLRAVENFAISGQKISGHPELITALATVKQACALANRDVGMLSPEKADAIVGACEEIRAGRLHRHFVVDVLQGGAGTSTNMNANEVIANRALELLGHRRGDYGFLHPIDDVNMSQSTNDVYPTAVKLSVHMALLPLVTAVEHLAEEFSTKAHEFKTCVKMGRTQLQDAVPMTVGAEFGAFASLLAEQAAQLRARRDELTSVHLGGTAIGTGLNAPAGYAAHAVEHLSDVTGVRFRPARDLIASTQDVRPLTAVSGGLRDLAVLLTKICNDLRLLSSGPRAGLGELRLPAVQAGSSMMPGKVNPVIAEMVGQVCFEALGSDVAIANAAAAGQLQLNAFEPLMAHLLLTTLDRLTSALDVFRHSCVSGIQVNPESLATEVGSTALATALSPHLGYAAASALATESLTTGTSVRELALQRGLVPASVLDGLLASES